ncbi:MAG: lysophospholipid acyltransferase family protein [Chitinophagaceae bacterium]
MSLFLKFFQVIYSVYALVLFVFFLIVITPIVMIASLFGKIRGGNIIYKACTTWGDIWLLLIGVFHRNIYIGPHDTTHACIFVANHISYMDIPVLVKTLRQPIRVLGKMEMSKIPIFGFLYRNAVVMVDRSSTDNRSKSVKTLKAVLKKGISIVIFPEGTFNVTSQPLKEFYNGAFRIAIETQTSIKPVVFPYTLDRLHYNSIFSLTPGRSLAVFMEEVPVKGLTLHDAENLKDHVFSLMDTELRKWRSYNDPGQEVLNGAQANVLADRQPPLREPKS